MKWTAIILLTLITIDSYSQGKIAIKQDQRIDKLIEKQVKNNKADPKIEGYRVQIHFSDNQNRVASERVRAQFSNDFPELKTYLEFRAPYYKIQAGDFIDKLDAFVILKKISKKYVGTYIVRTQVYFDEVYKKSN